MYELIRVGENTYYIESPAKVGLVTRGTDAYLIDSGSDKDAGKKALQVLEKEGLQLKAILNTHSHADHIGGNRLLQDRTGCAIYARGMEQVFAELPVLESTVLCGGFSPKVLRNKFLMAKESRVQPLTEEVLPEGTSIVPLPGHSFDMAGFRTGDDVLFLADCLSSEETLKKYAIAYLYDVGAALETLERVKTMQARLFVPSHAPACEEIAPLAQLNIDKTLEIAGRILDLCRAPQDQETVITRLFEAYGLRMTYQQYALVGSTVRSYLSWLIDTGKLSPEPDGTRMLFRTI